MTNLLDKLNLLIQSNINNVLESKPSLEALRRNPSSSKSIPQFEKEIAGLRERINQALAYEDELQAKMEALQEEVFELDALADEAVKQQKDAEARLLVQKLQRKQQQVAIAQADLDDHRRVTQELILQVNRLDATIGDARHVNQPKSTEQGVEIQETLEEKAVAKANEVVGRVSDLLRDTREKVNEAMNQSETESKMKLETVDEPEQEVVEDDLSQRRSRLAKPDSGDLK